MDRLERIDHLIDRVEQILIVLFLSLMILIAFAQIVLRNVFTTGLAWGDPFLRNLVLWVGFIGATLATREGKHINIELVSRWLPSLGKNLIDSFIHLFSFSICGFLAYAALKFIKNEVQMGNMTFGGIPAWIPELILPATFLLMTLRFGLRSFKNLSEIGKTGTLHHQGKET